MEGSSLSRAAVRPLRVVQWATGNIGSYALRCVLDHPALSLAGLYVHTPEKAGRDAGELCGRDACGVTATNDIDEILALEPDCVLYMPIACDVDDVCRLLSSGANIVTTRGDFHHPASMKPEIRLRVDAACHDGGTSIHSTGSSPGFITEALPITLTSIQRRLTSLTIHEYADMSRRDSPGMLFDVMGIGRAPTTFTDRQLTHARTSFGPSLRLLAESLGLPLDSIEASGELATARHDVRIAAGTVKAGTVAAQRITASGIRNGRPLLSFTATWYVTTDIDRDWDLRETGWRVSVDGDAAMDIDVRFPVPLERFASVSPAYTANRAVNAVRIVCEAAPGIRTTADLPQVIATLG
ncbi:hypothetical protein ABZ863_18045 [Saccharomonospora sp. NPDC046836]|uniref:NAD(P)H-dependent amine dehydrogenase family protein n=1 Tax=Saccharomonospora sp. NPDC046836 TaxID=3156921 RepID=UPI0033ECDC2A